MAKKKSTRGRKQSRRTRKKTSLRGSILKALGALCLLVALVVAVAMVARFLTTPQKPASVRLPAKAVRPAKKPLPEKPTFEIYPREKIPAERPLVKPPPKNILPKVAIIIDDLGYDGSIAQKFIDLKAALTYSILPYSPYRKKIARLARARGYDVMLHLPMEPVEYPRVNPGPGTLLSSMSPDALIGQLRKDLDEVPSIKGVNNHMGSRLTTESERMNQIFSVLKKRKLFFIDSRTTAKTRCKSSARLFHLPFAQRDVFIDHHPKADFIRRQLKELVRVAQRHGEAVGIVHPHSVTYRILREELPELQKKVQLVPASEIVRPAG